MWPPPHTIMRLFVVSAMPPLQDVVTAGHPTFSVIVPVVSTGQFGVIVVFGISVQPALPSTKKVIPLLFTPATVTTTFPVVAPLGTGATMLVALQFVGVAAVPLKVIVLIPCVAPNLAPLMVTGDQTGPDDGFKIVMLGVELCTNVIVALSDYVVAT